ncbi:unnamed protein product, partial [Brachionus calyciflorus]
MKNFSSSDSESEEKIHFKNERVRSFKRKNSQRFRQKLKELNLKKDDAKSQNNSNFATEISNFDISSSEDSKGFSNTHSNDESLKSEETLGPSTRTSESDFTDSEFEELFQNNLNKKTIFEGNNPSCESNDCKKISKKDNYQTPASVICLDYVKKFEYILTKNYELINQYKEETLLKKSSDIINSNAYLLNEEKKISIILFTDDVQFSKSSNKKVYAILGQIFELPPKIRFSMNNIISFLFFIGPKPNFNILFNEYLKDFVNILNSGIFLKQHKLNINIKIHACVADAPARARISNNKQFNGLYGCLHCLNPGQLEGNTRIYEYGNYPLRDKNSYGEALKIIGEGSKEFEGVKGPCFLSLYMPFPDGFILDYMHLCLEGTFKSLLNIWLDSKNHFYKEFYM